MVEDNIEDIVIRFERRGKHTSCKWRWYDKTNEYSAVVAQSLEAPEQAETLGSLVVFSYALRGESCFTM